MKQKVKGSILAYSMIVIAMMFAIVGSISAVSILEKKSAGSSHSSAQSFQVADSAVQIAIKQLNDAYKANENSTIANAFPGCSGSAVVDSQIDAKKLYKLTFYDTNDNQLPNCNRSLKDVESIKAVGTYENTVRAVKVAIAAATGGPADWNCTIRTGDQSSGMAFAKCNANEKVISGGCFNMNIGNPAAGSFPADSGGVQAWGCSVSDAGDNVRAYANCCL
ncbi:MAG: hypothetical protein ACD_5C00178G0003 [uncultured bacterium]|nr:MAG: hypothetical protein ACD_5C00178G0003 [uncultured bacterium]